MKLSSLRYLVSFADEGSFSRAAERCHISQPTLSVAIQNLEADLGVLLIERHKSHANLTDIGQQVVAQARRALDEAKRVKVIAQAGKDPLHGTFRLGVIHTIGPYLLPGLIGSIRQLAPQMTLYIEESMTALLTDALKYGTVDAAIVALPFSVPGIATRALYDESFAVVVPKGHALASRQSIAASELHGEEMLVLKAGNCFREQVLDACPNISHAEGSLQQGHSIETIRCMVASGHGISVLPTGALVAPYQSELLVAIPFEQPQPSRRVALAWRQDFSRPQAIETLVQAVGRMPQNSFQLLVT